MAPSTALDTLHTQAWTFEPKTECADVRNAYDKLQNQNGR